MHIVILSPAMCKSEVVGSSLNYILPEHLTFANYISFVSVCGLKVTSITFLDSTE